MLPLPIDVLRLICSYDPTYRHVFNLCLLQLEVLFREHRFARRVLRAEAGAGGARALGVGGRRAGGVEL